MGPDIFFDCPRCAQPLKVAQELIGSQVECPSCRAEVPVPIIRVGLRPVFPPGIKKVSCSKFSSRMGTAKAELLVDNLESLVRRYREQERQLDYLVSNAGLAIKQIQLVQEHVRQMDRGPEALEVSEGEGSRNKECCSRKLSLVLASVTVLLSVIVLGFLARAL